MQIRPVAPTTLARRPLAVATTAKPAVQPTTKPAAAPVKPQTDAGFGSDIFQSGLYALMNIGQLVKLPAGLSGIVQMLPKSTLGIVNIALGGMNAFKDWRSLSNPLNTRNSDNYTRLAGDAAVIVGGVALLAGAAVAPVVPLIGAGVAALGCTAGLTTAGPTTGRRATVTAGRTERTVI